jgi:hypothetical protein
LIWDLGFGIGVELLFVSFFAADLRGMTRIAFCDVPCVPCIPWSI